MAKAEYIKIPIYPNNLKKISIDVKQNKSIINHINSVLKELRILVNSKKKPINKN